MKSALFILIGYIICTFKVEIIEGAAEEKSENVKITPVVDTTGTGEPTDNNMQPDVAIITSSVDTTGAAEQPDNIMQPKITVITPAADPTAAAEQPDNIMQPKITVITPAVDPTAAAEQPDNIMQPIVTVITPAVDILGMEQPPDNNMQPDMAIITNPVDTTGVAEQSDSVMKPNPTYVEGQADNIEQQQNVEKTKVTERQEIQANDTGPSKIKVEDALKILHKSKKIYAAESIALIKKLQWLRSISNITEIEIEHKIDPKSFDYLSDTEIGSSSSSLARRHGLGKNPDFLALKEAILKERGQSIKFKRFPRLQ